MSQAKCFRVVGINRKNGQDVDIRVKALSADNAKVKAEMHGVEVTAVQKAKLPPNPVIKPWWQFQSVQSTGFGLPRRQVLWFTLLMAMPAALVNQNGPFKAEQMDSYALGGWIGVWCVYAMLIHAVGCIPSYLGWRIFEQNRAVAGNLYVATATVMAVILVYAIGLSAGRLGQFMN